MPTEAEQAKEEDAAKLARALEQSSEHLANALALKEDGDIGLRVAASKVGLFLFYVPVTFVRILLTL